MTFTPQFLDEIRARVALADVVGRKVKLTKKGREYSGLCPFHNEKTPSFTVSEEKGFFHCFGCGAHGDVIGFEMRAGGLSFPDAVEKLAGEAGLQVPKSTPEEVAKAKKQAGLYEVVEAACAYFEKQLRMPGGRAALDYLHGRDLSDEVIARFRLGYAPPGNALKGALKREGIEEEQLLQAGLMGRPDDGRSPYDTFRDRVIFPITDRQGRVIAFGGRVMGDGMPKYLNSPETPLFHKGRVLYGLAQARAPAHKAGEVIVTEGYMDVIALHRAGFHNAVAPLGTALTELQLAELWRLAPEPTLCFDGDAAGRRAASRAAERALAELKPGNSLKFAVLPAGKDPDDLLTAEGPGAMTAILESAIGLAEAVWNITLEGHRTDTPERRAKFEKDLFAMVGQIGDDTVREHYRQLMRQRVWETFAKRKAKGRGGQGSAPSDVPGRPSADPRTGERALASFAAFLLANPEVLERHVDRVAEAFQAEGALSALMAGAVEVLSDDPHMEPSDLLAALEKQGHGSALSLARPLLPMGEADPAALEIEFSRMVATLQKQTLVMEMEEVQRAMEEEGPEALWERYQSLREEYDRLCVREEGYS